MLIGSRYDHSYPYVVAETLLGDNRDGFQFLSCSGAVTQQVIEHQVDLITPDQDLILVSAGRKTTELLHNIPFS